MIQVHHLNNSRSQRILWLLEELGIDYEIVHHLRDPMIRRAPAALRDVHPLGKSPVITDGGLILAESGAIIEYLIGKYGDGRLIPPPGSADHTRYLYWLHFAEGTVMMQLLVRLYLGMVGDAAAALISVVDADIERVLGYMESELTPGQFFAGPALTGADINLSFPLEAGAARGRLPAETYPKLAAYLVALQERPAYQRALERGGPYELKL
ncbi:MAG TPA: glutathione S-transferase family protein [Aliidongia sp.]|nr:glutathione S-transferase family protein [Aliidongia sp.]